MAVALLKQQATATFLLGHSVEIKAYQNSACKIKWKTRNESEVSGVVVHLAGTSHG